MLISTGVKNLKYKYLRTVLHFTPLWFVSYNAFVKQIQNHMQIVSMSVHEYNVHDTRFRLSQTISISQADICISPVETHTSS